MATVHGPLPVATTLNGLLNRLAPDCLNHLAWFLCDKDFKAFCNVTKHSDETFRLQWIERRRRRHLQWLNARLEHYKCHVKVAMQNYDRYIRLGNLHEAETMEDCYERYRRIVARVTLEISELQSFGSPR